MNDEATFEALTDIDWTSDNLQTAGEGERAQDDPVTSSTRCQDDVNSAGSDCLYKVWAQLQPCNSLVKNIVLPCHAFEHVMPTV